MKHGHLYSKVSFENMPSEIKKRQILCESTYIRYLEWGKIMETENSLGDGREK